MAEVRRPLLNIAPAGNTTLLNLPDEALVHIVSWLDPVAWVAWNGVCRRMREVGADARTCQALWVRWVRLAGLEALWTTDPLPTLPPALRRRPRLLAGCTDCHLARARRLPRGKNDAINDAPAEWSRVLDICCSQCTQRRIERGAADEVPRTVDRRVLQIVGKETLLRWMARGDVAAVAGDAASGDEWIRLTMARIVQADQLRLLVFSQNATGPTNAEQTATVVPNCVPAAPWLDGTTVWAQLYHGLDARQLMAIPTRRDVTVLNVAPIGALLRAQQFDATRALVRRLGIGNGANLRVPVRRLFEAIATFAIRLACAGEDELSSDAEYESSEDQP